jgi:UDP-2,3-diacylglucosamine pyrophosphatase LpxH
VQLFVSDLHLTDHDDGCAPSDRDLLAITQTLGDARTDEKHTLVLLGDIVDLLRSDRWHQLWLAGESPWRDIKGLRSNGFKRFTNSAADDCAWEIARQTVARYPKFVAELRDLVQAGRLEVIYVPGNHDYMAQLSPQVREVLINAFSLRRNPKDRLPEYFIDHATSVYAIHGHAYDPANWHLKPEGLWAFGDAIVLRLVNRVMREAPQLLGQTAPGIEDLDAIEPVMDTPIFVLWLMNRLPAAKRKILKGLWNNSVRDLLALEDFRADGYRAVKTERRALKLSTMLNLADFMTKHDRLVVETDDRWVRNVEELTSRGRAQRFRYVLFGHTHHAGITLLDQSTPREPRFYVNLGCWRKVVARPNRKKQGPFVPTRVSTMFVVDQHETPGYTLLREWHAH